MATEVADGRHTGAQRTVGAAFDAWQELFADLFTRLRERCGLRSDAEPAALSTLLLATLEGGQALT